MLDTEEQPDYYEKPEISEEQQLADKLQVFGSKLQTLVQEQVSKRHNIEERWVEDLRQYNGKYTPEVEAALSNKKDQSRVFVNITRNKTNAAEARLSDMLFPTDDRNWGIKPTPVPQIADVAQMQPGTPQAQQARAILQKAKKSAEEMTKEIEDQLSESNYHAKCRDMIHDACVLGTGVIKGPVVVGQVKQNWQTLEDGVSILQMAEEFRPDTQYVDPWNFYPDMSAATVDESEFFLERRHLTRKGVIDLARNEHYLVDQIRKVLKEDARSTQNTYNWQNELRAIHGLDSVTEHDKYELWEYNGPISKDEMRSAGIEPDEDELVEYQGTVHFIGNHVIRVSIHPMETQDLIYRVFSWEKDPSSIFGYGVPYLMRDQQAVMNAAWRMTLDNAGVSTGPQIVVDIDAITPADGDWTITPRKVWHKKKTGIQVDHAFQVYQINCNQADLMNIFTTARQLADEETNLPLIAQGEQSDHVTKTARGMDMLMNSANIVLRRAVKNFDDDVTRPHITGYYNWNMQFGENPAIKGDFAVDARGSGALLAREMQQERLLQFSQIAASYPDFKIRTDWDGLYKQLVKHMQISADDVVLPDEKVQEIIQKQQQQQPPVDPIKKMEIDLKAKQQQLDAQQAEKDFALQVTEHDLKREIEFAKLALAEGKTLKEIQAKLGIEGRKDQTKRDVEAMKGNNDRAKTILQNKNIQAGFDTF